MSDSEYSWKKRDREVALIWHAAYELLKGADLKIISKARVGVPSGEDIDVAQGERGE